MSLIAEPAPGLCASDQWRFLRAWLRAPLRTGAVAPSSAGLARAMAFAAAPRPGGRVLELGPGTGVVTQALIDAGVREENLLLVELDEDFASMLQARFPKAAILRLDAFAAVEKLAAARVEIATVVSSLPLFTYPKPLRAALRDNALRLVGPYGRLVQFTYNLVSPIPLGRAVRAVRSRRIWANLPSAVVWTYQQPAHMASSGYAPQYSAGSCPEDPNSVSAASTASGRTRPSVAKWLKASTMQ